MACPEVNKKGTGIENKWKGVYGKKERKKKSSLPGGDILSWDLKRAKE